MTAFEILEDIMQHRNWHRGKIEIRLAGEYKKNLKKGTLSYKKASEILTLLGWGKIKEEEWEKAS